MTTKKMGIAIGLFAILTLGSWQSTQATNGKKANNTVKVYSCAQIGDNIQITLKKNSPTTLLKAGCSNAGHGPRDYSFSCTSDKTYKVEWESCPLVPAIATLRVTNPATGSTLSTANSSYQVLDGKYAAKQLVSIPNTINNLQFNIQTKNTTTTSGYTYAFAWADATSTINYTESLAKSLAGQASFSASSVSNLSLTDYYRGRSVTMVAFMRNNDGISKVPNMPVEVDDIIAIHVRVLPLKPVQVCENLNGGDGTYTLCLGKMFTYGQSNIVVTYATQLDNRVNLTIGGMQFVLRDEQSISLLAADKKTVMTFQIKEMNKTRELVKLRVSTQTIGSAIIM